jgi:hypothetical protein
MFIKYINKPIICLYMVASIVSEFISLRNFKFITKGVGMDFHSNILNLFIISREYFP